MKIENVRAVLTGHRILNPEMQRSWALVRIETDTGTVGWGEASTNWGHSYPTVFRAVVEDVCSRHLEGRDPLAIRDRVADLRVALDGYLGWEGLSSQTIGAIEIALWDILGKTLGAPIHQLLGGRAYPIPLYGTGTTMFEQSHEWHTHYFDQCVSLGFKGIKVRLGRAVDEDVDLVRLVREHVGPDLLIGVDSYWFHDVDSAIELVHKIAPYRIHFFEEPIPQYQIDGLERLQHSSPIRVAVGERVYSAAGLRRPRPARCGSRVRTGRHTERRVAVVHGDRRHRRALVDRGHPAHRWSDRRRPGGEPPVGDGGARPACSSSTSSATSR